MKQQRDGSAERLAGLTRCRRGEVRTVQFRERAVVARDVNGRQLSSHVALCLCNLGHRSEAHGEVHRLRLAACRASVGVKVAKQLLALGRVIGVPAFDSPCIQITAGTP